MGLIRAHGRLGWIGKWKYIIGRRVVGFVRYLRSQDRLREVAGQHRYISTVAIHSSNGLLDWQIIERKKQKSCTEGISNSISHHGSLSFS